MDVKYNCKDCNESFESNDDNKCPKCESTNIEKKIPMFFSMNSKPENSDCEGGICSFGDKK